MKIYKRSIFKILISIIQSILGGLFVSFLIEYFTKKINYSIISFVVIELIFFYMIISSDRIKFELEGNNFRYYKKNKLIKEYNLDTSKIGYKTVTGVYVDTFDLYINEDVIDCEPIGRYKFIKMYNDLSEIVEVEIKKVKMEKKND